MPEDLTQIDPIIWIVLAVVALVVIGLLVVLSQRRRRRSDDYEQRYGREYQRTIDRVGSREAAQRELDDRSERRERWPLQRLSAPRRDELLDRWERLQAQFVEAPAATIRNADVLLDEAARDRGYPDADAEQRLQDLALDHSDEVVGYRRATGRTGADTPERSDDEESLRRTMVAGRELFHAIVLAGRGGGNDAVAGNGGPSDRGHRRSPTEPSSDGAGTDGAGTNGAAPHGERPDREPQPVAQRPPRAEQRDVPPAAPTSRRGSPPPPPPPGA